MSHFVIKTQRRIDGVILNADDIEVSPSGAILGLVLGCVIWAYGPGEWISAHQIPKDESGPEIEGEGEGEE